MAWFDRIANVFRSRRLNAELDRELSFHIEELVDRLVEGGMAEDEARREAAKRFGNYAAQKEKTRDMNVSRMLEAAVNDLRYGLRQLKLSPGFTVVAVLSLGLGIGANTAIFQLIDAIRLRALPVHQPSELAAITSAPGFFTRGWYSARNRAFTYAQIETIRKRQQAFSDLLAFGNTRFNLSKGGESRFAEGYYVSANFLNVLGVVPMIGRGFTPEDDKPDCSQAGALLSHSFWQREFGGDPNVLSRNVSLDGRDFPIIGVTPPGFIGVEPGHRLDVAIPICADNLIKPGPKGRMFLSWAWWLTPIGRLNPGWTVERASAHIAEISPAVFRETVPENYPPDATKKYLENKMLAVPASAGVSSLRRQYGNPLWLLLAATGLVLLIACANLANLLLARASTREREIAVRQALGASRARVVGQLLMESMLLAALGAAAGMGLARVLSPALVAFLDNGNGTIHIRFGLDWHILGFALVLTLITCLLFGLAPALRATSASPSTAMRGGRGTTATAERNGLRRLLVVSQISLSLVLLVGALLFGRSLYNLLSADVGFHSQGVIVASINARLPGLPPERRKMVIEQLEERIRAQPGVVSAASAWLSPFGGAEWNQPIASQGKDGPGEKKTVWMNRVGPGYFHTMGTAIVKGRDFTPRDDLKAPSVAIVNEAFVLNLLNGADPIGRTFRAEQGIGEPDKVYEIVGLVRNTKYRDLREEFRPMALFPIKQDQEDAAEVAFMVRARGPIAGVMDTIRRQMAEVHPGLLAEYRVLDTDIGQSVLLERLMANLSGGFAVLAGLLSALGLYGVMSYMVARRRGEIGVRIALGADRRSVLALVFREAFWLVLAGLVIGLACSFALSRYAEAMLFGLKPNDAVTLALACALLVVTALLATLIPALRALGLDPAAALREE